MTRHNVCLSLYVLLLLHTAAPCYSQQTSGTCPGPSTGAFIGCYYSNTTLSGNPVLVRTDSQINFDWANGSPDPSLSPLNFSVRWQGNFAFTAGNYTFNAIVSDGVRLYIDGTSIFVSWHDRAPTWFTIPQAVTQGTHLITVEYYERTGGATAQINWISNSPVTQPPIISSFTATPSNSTPAQPVTLAWSVSGATSITVDHSVGDVSNRSTITVYPAQTTTYVLTASSGTTSTTAQVTVTVTSTVDTQPPVAPTLVSAIARSPSEVDLAWLASTDNVGVAGYQIIRNGSAISSVPGTMLTSADTAVSGSSTYTYSIKAYDAAGNYSVASNLIQVTTPPSNPPPGACPGPSTGVFTGCYYSNTTLSGSPVLVRTDNQINFDWGNSSPDKSLPPLNFSVRWQGNFALNQGTYTFTVIASDGIRLYLDGFSIMDFWRDRSPTLYTASQIVTQGSHLIEVDYYERTGGAVAQVSWESTAPVTQAPVISHFTAAPSISAPSQPVTLSWSVSGATSINVDNAVGDVTGSSSTVVAPAQTTTYTLTASNGSAVTTALVTVTVTSAGGPSVPTTPTLVSAIAKSASEVDLTWTASTANLGIASYQVLRNGWPVGSMPGSQLTYADTSVYTSSTYTYAVKAYDTASNYSAPSNSIQVTTPASPGISVKWYGGCWLNTTIYGITGNYQAIDFALTTPTPVPVQGTLFDGLNCTANGGDNMNDFNTLTGSSHMLRGFTHNPNAMPTSAIYWIGDRTPDGRCPVGSQLCSGCVNYTATTLSCSLLP